MQHTNKPRRTPYVKPVKRIELTGRHVKLRAALAVLLFLIGITAILIGLHSALNTEPGWKVIEVSSEEPHYGGEFLLNYDFSSAGKTATSQEKRINELYSAAMTHAYRLFNPDVSGDGLAGLYDINVQYNEPVTVEETLYSALALATEQGNRMLYLAPVYAAYDGIYMAESDAAAAQYDPTEDADQAEYIRQLMTYVSDPQMIKLELLSEQRVCLRVSQEYLQFAEEHGIRTFMDFHWMRNAFIIDYAASILEENGLTAGYLASFDGFTRNLDSRGFSYSANVFDRVGTEILMPAVFQYDVPMSIVTFRDYPMSEQDRWHYYVYQDGRIASMYTDPMDGMPKTANSDLIAYSSNHSCAELLLQATPVYVADDLSEEALHALAEEGIFSVWCSADTVSYTDPTLTIALVEESGGETYSLSLAE